MLICPQCRRPSRRQEDRNSEDMRSGLVSITFRKLSPAQIVDLVCRAGLEGIEWGGDVHVPHGEVARAREVGRITSDAGLAVASYGSYYRAGHGEGAPFETILQTAAELKAPLIRVWAGIKGSADADADDKYRGRQSALGRLGNRRKKNLQ